MLHRTTIYTLVLFTGISFIACDKDDMQPVPDNQAFEGNFISSAHPTSGTASIDEAGNTLTLTNFKSDSGPDLNIWLATDIANVTNEYVDLGDIKGVDGSYTYDLPANLDYTEYKFVVVWCVAFNVNFGYAELSEK